MKVQKFCQMILTFACMLLSINAFALRGGLNLMLRHRLKVLFLTRPGSL